MRNTVIITAGGIGKRMEADLPKQFLSICGTPILQHTIKKFYVFDRNAQILLTLPEDWIPYWSQLCQEHDFKIEHQVINGGVERYDSIKNALSYATGEKVLVHDGVRPFVSTEVINRVVEAIGKEFGVVPAIPMTSSIRKGSPVENVAVDRSEFWSVQTPQGFTNDMISRAYEQEFSTNITDDASLIEQMGGSIKMVKGDLKNIKITTPLDLLLAERILDC